MNVKAGSTRSLSFITFIGAITLCDSSADTGRVWFSIDRMKEVPVSLFTPLYFPDVLTSIKT